MTNKQHARRQRGDGGYRNRGGDSWELKFSVTDPTSGLRKFKYITFKGTEADARKKLRDLVKQVEDGGFIAPTRQLLGPFLDVWEAGLTVGPKTAQRYKEIVRLQIRPHLGDHKIQAIPPSRLDAFYSALRAGVGPDGSEGQRPLAPQTILHVHRLLVNIFELAVRDRLITSNPARAAKRPRVERAEVEILGEIQVTETLTKLRGRSMFQIALVGVSTGMRRGEILGLRWRDVELDGAELRVQQSLEQTNAGLRFKAPKSKAGRRTITLPAFAVAELRLLKARQAEERLALGLGKEGPDALVFRQPDGSPLWPDNVSSEWRRLVKSLKLPKVSLHALRHTHASQLIAAGLDVLTISRRLGHSKPSITLDVYGHLFKPTDGGAAAIFDRAFGNLQAD